jgi:hypothetical protein
MRWGISSKLKFIRKNALCQREERRWNERCRLRMPRALAYRPKCNEVSKGNVKRGRKERRTVLARYLVDLS